MLLVQTKDESSGLMTYSLKKYDNKDLDKSKTKFEELKKNGTIVQSEFNDTEWMLYTQDARQTIKFAFDELLFSREFKKREFYSFNQFVDSVKCYVLNVFENTGISSLSNFLNILKKVLDSTRYFNDKYKNKWLDNINLDDSAVPRTCLTMVRNFVDYLDLDEFDDYLEIMDNDLSAITKNVKQFKKNKNLMRRTLSNFQSVFLFDKLIDDFWYDESTSKEERIYYSALYLWWKITNILPLRPTEFAVTPYNCLNTKDDKYVITVRRSALKGNTASKSVFNLKRTYARVKHSLEDYTLFTYPISEQIALEIMNYRKLYNEFRKEEEIDGELPLFFTRYDSGLIDICRHKETELPVFNSKYLNKIIKRFYYDIVQNRMKYTVIPKTYDKDSENGEDEQLADNCIEIMNAGDTRHFALLNMVLNDFNPILVKDFANQLSVDTAYHYFGNTTELVKCISYNKYKRLVEYDANTVIDSKTANITGKKVLIAMKSSNKKYVEVDYGRCHSEKFYAGKIDDCISAGDDCEHCDYFVRTQAETKEERALKVKQLEDEIRREGECLGHILASFKDTIDENNELQKSILRLQNKSALYQKMILNER